MTISKINRKRKKQMKKSAIYQENMFGRCNPKLKDIQITSFDGYYAKYSVKKGISNNHLMDGIDDDFFKRRKIHYLTFAKNRYCPKISRIF